MNIEIQITNDPVQSRGLSENYPGGAIAEFSGVVRDLENGEKISALEYEAYSPMAENEMRRILESLAEQFPCLAARVIHRVGVIPVGDTAIYVCIAAKHRGEAFAMLAEFMNQLKQDVPIWKRRGIVAAVCDRRPSSETGSGAHRAPLQLDQALAEIRSRCRPLPPVRVPLAEAFGRVLRENVSAIEDLPAVDKSTRDGYAILQNDSSETFSVVDAIHAADWKPRQLKAGEAVRIATGGSLPCESARVVMQEHVERNGDKIKVLRREPDLNLRKRGEEIHSGQIVLKAGEKLDAGKLALLATVGCTQPPVSPKLQVLHFTTGDEIIPLEKKPKPGQIRDSNSILIRSLLQNVPCELTQKHLPENFELTKKNISAFRFPLSAFDLILVSGGASVGDKDFTRSLLEWLGFEIIFNRIAIRPGAPLIFGIADGGSRIAFGLPGNPLSHFVCFQLFVAAALKKLIGGQPQTFLRGTLASKLDDAPNPRETLWSARLDAAGLQPLAWTSSGDVTCLAKTNALIRVPANRGSIEAGAEVEFLPTGF
ncbi:MAG TPA: molybdenum cofactor biosynthesis protein MoaE [Candidatus Aquilonibacter sp.]|nr:molybdenum cofactor biosynthesis protein MoaE [Candidatus Aquilonibacter sp.]